MLSILINLLLAVHVIVSLLIVLITLMQRPKNEGLGAAFGGGMTENMFGAQTTNVLAKGTRWLGGLFFLLTLTLSVLYANQSREEDAVSQKLRTAPAPVVTPAVSPSPGVPAPGLQSISAETFEPSPSPAVETAPETEIPEAVAPVETPAAAAEATTPAEFPVATPAVEAPAAPEATPAS